jgi:hypothetical protein
MKQTMQPAVVVLPSRGVTRLQTCAARGTDTLPLRWAARLMALMLWLDQ